LNFAHFFTSPTFQIENYLILSLGFPRFSTTSAGDWWIVFLRNFQRHCAWWVSWIAQNDVANRLVCESAVFSRSCLQISRSANKQLFQRVMWQLFFQRYDSKKFSWQYKSIWWFWREDRSEHVRINYRNESRHYEFFKTLWHICLIWCTIILFIINVWAKNYFFCITFLVCTLLNLSNIPDTVVLCSVSVVTTSSIAATSICNKTRNILKKLMARYSYSVFNLCTCSFWSPFESKSFIPKTLRGIHISLFWQQFSRSHKRSLFFYWGSIWPRFFKVKKMQN
jgi:hypothetical protein